ncbi:class I SAM-dependent methyltransferase [Auritidibacter ignavus]|uniref:class I SAM-dependent methyltransferase n=1 Tax=Auritidibacter ignavus TaxID=678932 RepID=UPI00244CAFF4|nr:class I SAM-dependent methyltransferase [Auritidibacter ignavus]WGH83613.1 class I SAM-dependent methyltransferase [Auritidibacter ignavus]
MTTADPSTGNYGDELIDVYDLMYAGRSDVHLLPDFCRQLDPAAARVLEYGIGTGRLALPMARAGYEVTGIDSSVAMLDVLSSRTQGRPVTGIHGDFRTTVISERFDIVLILTNTLFMLPAPDEQRRVITQAANNLTPTGKLVIETYDPQIYLERQSPFSVTVPLAPSTLLTDTVITDRRRCRVTQIHAVSRPSRIDTITEESYWLTPRELDLVAESAGLQLTHRYADFDRSPVTEHSRNFVSVYTLRTERD